MESMHRSRHGRRKAARIVTVSSATIVRAVFITIGGVTLALTLWTIADVLLLVFGSILVAVLLHTIAAPLRRFFTGGAALGVAGLLLLLFLAGSVVLFGSQISTQLSELSTQIPSAVEKLEEIPGFQNSWRQLREQIGSSAGSLLKNLTNFALTAVSAAANAVLLIIAGVFLALQPERYREGAVLLFPPTKREAIDKTLGLTGKALRQWLLGQLIAMLLVGFLMWIALTIAGLPSAAALALIAALAEFVPLIGPIAAGIPPLLVAFGQGGYTVLWTLLAVVAVQQIESNMIMPLIQRRMVSLPPVLTLFSVLAFGGIFGLPGLLLATPLTVAGFVAVKVLYLRETLGEPVPVPGEKR